MSDKMRRDVRSAIAEMVAGSPEPPAYERVVAKGHRPAVRRSGPMWALAAFVVVLVVVGAAAWLRPPVAPLPPVADVPSIGDDVAAAALPSVFVAATRVPDGLSLVRSERGFADRDTVLVYAPSGETGGSSDADAELSIRMSAPESPDFPPDISVIAGRLTAAYVDATITETIVRGQPGFLIDADGSEIGGWTAAVVTIEEPGLISEVQGRFVDAAEVLAVARGLVPVSRAEFEQRAADAIDWDLQVDAQPVDPNRFLDLLAGVPGVESATLSTLHLNGPAVAWSIESDPLSQAIPTTTAPVTTTTTTTVLGSVTTGPAVGAMISVMVTLKDGVDPETVAAGIHDLTDFAQVSYSPAIAATISQEYLEAVLGDATIIHHDPIVYQPQPGPAPVFDTSVLGTEVELEAATATTESLDSTLQSIDTFRSPRFLGATPTPLEGPIVYIGAIDDGARLVLAFINDRDYFEITVKGSEAGAGGGRLGAFYYGVTSGGGGDDGWYMTVRVPLETSVVVFELDDGTSLWQRPIAGHGLFPVASDISGISGTITALAVDGTVIDQWSANP
ncbi:hypothetical protein BMS3Abin02_00998 [bacterium BMS3Abin02]|nr:hypothetical protein BMS3Abin02_00998 [bacterium BMS3Abin02]